MSVAQTAIAYSPNSEQIAAATVEVASEVDHLHPAKCPRQIVERTVLKEEGHNAPVKTILTERIKELAFDPSGTHSIRGQQHEHPIASSQGGADFVVPLLPALNARIAVPIGHPMATQHAYQTLDKHPVASGVRDEGLPGHRPTLLGQAALRMASAIGLTSGSPPWPSRSSIHGIRRTIQGMPVLGRLSRPPTTTGINRLL